MGRMGQTDRMRQGWDVGTGGSGRRNGSAAIGSWGATGGGKWRLPPLSLVFQGVQSICVSAENNYNTLHINPNCNMVKIVCTIKLYYELIKTVQTMKMYQQINRRKFLTKKSKIPTPT